MRYSNIYVQLHAKLLFNSFHADSHRLLPCLILLNHERIKLDKRGDQVSYRSSSIIVYQHCGVPCDRSSFPIRMQCYSTSSSLILMVLHTIPDGSIKFHSLVCYFVRSLIFNPVNELAARRSSEAL